MADKTATAGSRSTWWILAALVAGLMLGVVATGMGDGVREPAVRIATTIGGIWLDALKMTVVPLIIALLITGISGGSDAARAGGIAGRSFLWFVGVLTISAIVGAVVTPALIKAFPLPDAATGALRAGLAGIDRGAAASSVPKLEDFLKGLLPTNPVCSRRW